MNHGTVYIAYYNQILYTFCTHHTRVAGHHKSFTKPQEKIVHIIRIKMNIKPLQHPCAPLQQPCARWVTVLKSIRLLGEKDHSIAQIQALTVLRQEQKRLREYVKVVLKRIKRWRAHLKPHHHTYFLRNIHKKNRYGTDQSVLQQRHSHQHDYNLRMMGRKENCKMGAFAIIINN